MARMAALTGTYNNYNNKGDSGMDIAKKSFKFDSNKAASDKTVSLSQLLSPQVAFSGDDGYDVSDGNDIKISFYLINNCTNENFGQIGTFYKDSATNNTRIESITYLSDEIIPSESLTINNTNYNILLSNSSDIGIECIINDNNNNNNNFDNSTNIDNLIFTTYAFTIPHTLPWNGIIWGPRLVQVYSGNIINGNNNKKNIIGDIIIGIDTYSKEPVVMEIDYYNNVNKYELWIHEYNNNINLAKNYFEISNDINCTNSNENNNITININLNKKQKQINEMLQQSLLVFNSV